MTNRQVLKKTIQIKSLTPMLMVVAAEFVEDKAASYTVRLKKGDKNNVVLEKNFLERSLASLMRSLKQNTNSTSESFMRIMWENLQTVFRPDK